MKQSILTRIQQLGGNIDGVMHTSLQDDILAIEFGTVLYQKPEDTPWLTSEDTEPIYGIGEYIEAHEALRQSDPEAFYAGMTAHYYRLTDEPRSQLFWRAGLFTPFREGTDDHAEWAADFEDLGVDLSEVEKVTGEARPDFIQIFYSYGYPDQLYLCLADPDPDNPTLFGTDHEVFFQEVSNQGSFEDFLNRLMTPEELIAIVRKRLRD